MDSSVNATMICTRDVAVPMRDGIRLMADLYRPATGGPWPALVQRTPYNKSALLPPIGVVDPVRACLDGFAVLIQDVRGRYKSEGEFYPYRDEAADGYDTVEWTAAQPWCNGRVGVYGRSYSGATAWLAAVASPPHLGAIVPIVTASEYCEGWTYRQGALENAFILGWVLRDLAGIERAAVGAVPFEEVAALADRLPEIFASPTPPPWEEVFRLAPYVRDWLDHAYDDAYWGPWAIWPRLHAGIAPSLSIGGWFDFLARGALDNFTRLQAMDGTAGRHALIMGPWAHTNPLSQIVGDVDFGMRASPGFFDVPGALLNWFRRWLMGPEHARPQPPVQAFAMGANRWLSAQTWPLGATTETLYLTSGGAANGLDGDGRLVRAAPTAVGADSTTYHADQPVPTLGGGCADYPANRAGAFDQRPIERRPDVLVYTGEPLDRPLAIAGSVTAAIFASAAEGEFDLAVKLVDVAPDGYARNVADGIARSQHVVPPAGRTGPVNAYAVDLGPTANVFAAGHRIRVDVALSSYPRFDLNPLARDGSKQTISHGGPFPSRVTLPVKS
ncbi:MAG: CocE/NonD family hydrolase [Chloroflexi bacterium]|nr:CocE/NonD family hydrolase [Chloroflexota bacterium]